MSQNPSPSDSPFIKWIKEYWEVLAGLIGAIIFIVDFILKWRDNPFIFTIVASGILLVLWLFFLCWVGFSKTIKKPTILTPTAEALKRIPRYPKWNLVAKILLILSIMAIIAGNLSWQNYQTRLAAEEKNMLKWKEVTEKLQKIEEEKKFVVAIAIFDGDEEKYRFRDQMLVELSDTVKDFGDIKIKPIDMEITESLGSSYARKIGEENLADIIIWGWYSTTKEATVTIHVEYLSQDITNFIGEIEESEIYQLDTVDIDTFTIQSRVGEETESLIALLSGITFLKNRNYTEAFLRFDQALQNPSEMSEFAKLQLAYFYRGYIYLIVKQEYELALADFDNAILINKEFPEAYISRGAAYAYQRNYDSAIEDFKKAIQLEPQSETAQYDLGTSYLLIGQPDKAIPELQKATQIDNKYQEAYSNLGVAYGQTGQQTEAISVFTKAIELNPLDAEVYNNRGFSYFLEKQYELAFEDYTKALELDPTYTTALDNLVNLHNTRAIIYWEQEDYESAMIENTKALELNDQNEVAISIKNILVFSFNDRAKKFWEQEDYEAAMAENAKALELNDQNDAAIAMRRVLALSFNNRGFSYYKSKNYELALADYNKAIELSQNLPKSELITIYFNRAQVYFVLEDYENYVNDYTEIIGIDPNYPQHYYDRAFAYMILKKYDKVIDDTNTGIRLLPNCSKCYILRGRAYIELKEYDQALADFNNAIGLRIKDGFIITYTSDVENNPYYNLGLVYAILERHGEAVSAFTNALLASSHSPEVYYNRGLSYQALGQQENANADFRIYKDLINE